jgi:hypothetical protein
MPILRFAACVLASLNLSASLWAKADAILITVKGSNLAAPIEIMSPKALDKYSFFNGPGVSSSGGGYAPGTIIDWKSGTLAQLPARREHYQISVYWPPRTRPQAGCYSEKPCLVYVAFYDYDPLSGRGFVYLPGRGEPWHDLDVNLLYHGVEGHWFRATDSWTAFARALIVKRSSR